MEAFVIIVALGGLELLLWYLDRGHQKKQIDLLDSIWAELAIRNSMQEEAEKPPQAEKQPQPEKQPPAEKLLQ